jgi:outer membrane protein TolC
MKRVLLFLLLALISGGLLPAQKNVSLKECYDLSAKRSSLAGEANAYSEISKLNDQNLKNGWLPTLDANASMLYNSDVVDLSKSMGSIPALAGKISPMPHDQYKVTVDINQVIYDGGVIKHAREAERIDQGINRKQTETDLYKLREQINSYYFTTLLLDRQKQILKNFRALIIKRISVLQSAADNGAVMRSDIDVLLSEKLKVEQQLTENSLRKEAFLKVLSDLTGTVMDTATVLILPELQPGLKNELKRPELQLIDLKKEKLSAAMQLEQSKRLPKAFGFATLGYGKPPGQNFFADSFGPYYILGGGIKWNIFDWNKTRNQKEIIGYQQGILESRKQDLSDNLKRLLEMKNAEIESLQSLSASDRDQLALRKKISATAESRYSNGVITVTEYMNELNAEQQAEINAEIHRISLVLAKIEYLNISGNEIE